MLELRKLIFCFLTYVICIWERLSQVISHVQKTHWLDLMNILLVENARLIIIVKTFQSNIFWFFKTWRCYLRYLIFENLNIRFLESFYLSINLFVYFISLAMHNVRAFTLNVFEANISERKVVKHGHDIFAIKVRCIEVVQIKYWQV